VQSTDSCRCTFQVRTGALAALVNQAGLELRGREGTTPSQASSTVGEVEGTVGREVREAREETAERGETAAAAAASGLLVSIPAFKVWFASKRQVGRLVRVVKEGLAGEAGPVARAEEVPDYAAEGTPAHQGLTDRAAIRDRLGSRARQESWLWLQLTDRRGGTARGESVERGTLVRPRSSRGKEELV